MAEARCADYSLSASALQKWLRTEFNDATITVQVRHSAHTKSGFYETVSANRDSQKGCQWTLRFQLAGWKQLDSGLWSV